MKPKPQAFKFKNWVINTGIFLLGTFWLYYSFNDIIRIRITGKGAMKYADDSIYFGDFSGITPNGKGLWIYPDYKSLYFGDVKDGKPNGTGVYIHEIEKQNLPLLFFEHYGSDLMLNGVGDESINGVSTFRFERIKSDTWLTRTPGIYENREMGSRMELRTDSTAIIDSTFPIESNKLKAERGYYIKSDGKILLALLPTNFPLHPGLAKSGGGIYNYQYRGEWSNGKQHGNGQILVPKNHYYEGEFSNGKTTGKGQMWYSDGTQFKGEFVDGNRKDGYGEMTFSDGGFYKGYFKNGKCHGQGEMTYSDGVKYIGHWVNDMKQGAGRIIYKDGAFNGYFQNGLATRGIHAFQAGGQKRMRQLTDGAWVEY